MNEGNFGDHSYISCYQQERRPLGDLNCSAPQNGCQRTQITGHWADQCTNKLLLVCRQFRNDLRVKIPKRETWLAIQKELSENHNIQVNWETIREKIRNLKRSHKNAKQSWQFFGHMNYMFGDVCSSSASSSVQPVIDSSTSSNVVTAAENCSERTFVESEVIIQTESAVSDREVETMEVPTEEVTVEMIQVEEVIASTSNAVPLLNGHSGTQSSKGKGKRSQAWDTAAISALLKTCKRLKVALQQPTPEVWRAVSRDLEMEKYYFAWEKCREKKEGLDELFFGTLIPCGGKMYGVPWPHMTDMCYIHDVVWSMEEASAEQEKEGNEEDKDDDDDDSAEDDGVESNNAESGAKMKWDRTRTLLLLCEYEQRYGKFKTPGNRHSVLLREIRDELNAFTIPASVKQIKHRLAFLHQKFGEAYDKCGKSGEGKNTFEFYDEMLRFLKNSPTLDPPLKFSVGIGASYFNYGDKVGNRKGGREMPSVMKMKPGSRSSLQNRESASQATQLLEEVRKMREFMQERAITNDRFRERVLNMSAGSSSVLYSSLSCDESDDGNL